MNVVTRDGQKATEKRRLQFEFSPETFERMSSMKADANVASYAELVRNSLRLYEWFLSQKRQGRAILVKEDDKIKEIEFVF